MNAAGGRLVRELQRQSVAAVYLSDEALRLLRNNPDVEAVDPAFAAGNASVGSTVCVIDSGYCLDHEDLQDANVTGMNDPGTGNWYEYSCGHGSHVAGTILALDNAVGVVGVNRSGRRHRPDARRQHEPQRHRTERHRGKRFPGGVGRGRAAGRRRRQRRQQRNADIELAAPGVGVVSTSPFRVSGLTADGETWPGEHMSNRHGRYWMCTAPIAPLNRNGLRS